MTIQYYTKDVYGKMMIYLADAGEARRWQRISGKKTITGDDMTALAELTGVTFERVFPPDVKVPNN